MTPPVTPSSSPARDLPVIRHYHLLVYAFQHPFSGVSSDELRTRLGDRWEHWWQRLDPSDPTMRQESPAGTPDPAMEKESLSKTIDDTYFFLPHLRELLFPETEFIARGTVREQLAAALHPPGGVPLESRLPTTTLRRFTLRAGARRALAPARLRYPDGGPESGADFSLDWIDMALFPQGVGFLIFKVMVEPGDKQVLTMGQLNDFLFYTRILQPLFVGWRLAKWCLGTGEDAVQCEGAELIDFLLQEVSGGNQRRPAAVEPRLADYLLSKGQPAGKATPFPVGHYTATHFGQTYGDAFHLFSYVATSETVPAPGPGTLPPPAKPFEGEIERSLYEMMMLIDTNHPDFRPHPAVVEAWRKEGCVRLWENWQGALHADHMVFLGLGDSGWTREKLPHNVLNDYFNLYLLTLFQKIAISFLFPKVSRREGDLGHNLDRARTLWTDFLNFESRYWATEVTRRPQGKILYAAFQKALDVKMVYDELRSEVEDVQKFYEAQLQRRNNKLLLFLAVVGVPLGIITSLFGTSVLAKVPFSAWIGTHLPDGFVRIANRFPWLNPAGGPDEDQTNMLVWLALFLAAAVIYGSGSLAWRKFRKGR